jgi:hypothetical protein
MANYGAPSFIRPQAKALPKAAPGRFLNKASGRMETKQAMSKYRAPAAAKALGKAPQGPAPRTQPSGPAHAGPPLSPLEMNPAQLHAYNTTQVKQNVQAELVPFRQRTGEINNEEATAAKRYGGYGEATQSILGGIQQGQQASAKTASNEAAESALRASKAIETAGQTSAQQNAGYVDPQLKAALGNQTANVTATSQAHEAGTQAQNQNEANFLANVRAAAAQRVTEGQGGIASTYGKQRGEVGTQEKQALARMPGQISKLDAEGLNTKFNQNAVRAKLESEGVKLGIAKQALGQKAGEAAAKNATSRANAALAAGTSRANNERTTEVSRLNNAANLTYKEAHPPGSKPTAPKVPSPASAQKYISEVGAAEAKARLWLGNQKFDATKQKETREALARAGATGDQISAALNLVVYGRLGPNDQNAAGAYGDVRKLKPAWFVGPPKKK